MYYFAKKAAVLTFFGRKGTGCPLQESKAGSMMVILLGLRRPPLYHVCVYHSHRHKKA